MVIKTDFNSSQIKHYIIFADYLL